MARSASARPARPSPAELDERAHDAVRAEHLGHDQDQVRGGRALGQLAGEPHADDLRHRLVERLAEQHGLGLDAAHAVAQDAQAVDHRGVGIGPDQRVGEGDLARAVRVPAARHDRGQVLEVDLVDDAGAGRNDAQVAEGGLGPAQELVALAVALVLALHVEGERVAGAVAVDLDGMVDDQVGRHERVDPGRVAAQLGHGVAHRGQIDHGRDAGEVLEDDPRRHERDLDLGRRPGARLPGGEGRDVLLADDAAAGVAEDVLEQDLHRDRQLAQVQGGYGAGRCRGPRDGRSRQAGAQGARAPKGSLCTVAPSNSGSPAEARLA